MDEFALIKKYFAPLCPGGLDNDAAEMAVPSGHDLIVTSDTLNATTHFLADTPPEYIARKALRVNLSDLAAMGARPLSYQLNIAFPDPPSPDWLEGFTSALSADQQRFDITCSGGDTTRIAGPLSLSITALGFVPSGTALSRSGAREGDYIVLTGPVGLAALGLKIIQESLDFSGKEKCIKAYHEPVPRLDLAEKARLYSNAAIDVSDGLAADLLHICTGSGLGADVLLADLPLPRALSTALNAGLCTYEDIVSGGDDYQLILAVGPENIQHFADSHVIGRFVSSASPRVHFQDKGGEVWSSEKGGWSHF